MDWDCHCGTNPWFKHPLSCPIIQGGQLQEIERYKIVFCWCGGGGLRKAKKEWLERSGGPPKTSFVARGNVPATEKGDEKCTEGVFKKLPPMCNFKYEVNFRSYQAQR